MTNTPPFRAMAFACLCLAGPLAARDAPRDDLPEAMLRVHNAERTAVGVPPLSWSGDLAAHAAVWADHLASTGAFEHSGAPGEGENLWQGATGGFTPDQMAQAWADEKKSFQNGVFPDVSTTGNWANVGHYTQMIWGATTQVGCAIGQGGGNDILVCRYSPPGNYSGQNVF